MKVTDLSNGMLFYYKPYKYDSGLKKGKIIRLDTSGRGARHKVVMFQEDGSQTSEFECTSRAIYRRWTTDDETKWTEMCENKQFEAVRTKLLADEKAREEAKKQEEMDRVIAQLAVLGFEAVHTQIQNRFYSSQQQAGRAYGYASVVAILYTEKLAEFLEPLVNAKLVGSIFDAPTTEGELV